MSKPVPLLEVNALKKHFPIRGGVFGGVTAQVYAVDGVTFDIKKGETLSLVGESGCGKSTVGRAILRLVQPTDGEVYLDGQRIDNLRDSQLRPLRRRGAGGVPGSVQLAQSADAGAEHHCGAAAEFRAGGQPGRDGMTGWRS